MSILHTCSTHGYSLEQWVVGWAAGGPSGGMGPGGEQQAMRMRMEPIHR